MFKMSEFPVFLAVLSCGALIIHCEKVNFDGPALYQVTDPLEHGECPSWDPKRGLLLFVDVHKGLVYSYDYATKANRSISLSGDVAPVIQSQSDPDLLIVGLNRSIVALRWNGKDSNASEVKILATVAEKAPNAIFNEGKADFKGRLWIGTTGQGAPNGGAFYKLTRENVSLPIPILSSVDISNGLAWNKANNQLFYIDSGSYQVVRYDFDGDQGEITNPRVVFDLKENGLNFYPDGMTIDVDDNLWVALYGGGAVIKIDPKSGQLLNKIAIPAEFVTSLIWGGPNLDILFVTTSKFQLSDEQKEKQPSAGCVFALSGLGTKGLPVFQANLIDKLP